MRTARCVPRRRLQSVIAAASQTTGFVVHSDTTNPIAPGASAKVRPMARAKP